jgi:hypothetical protein
LKKKKREENQTNSERRGPRRFKCCILWSISKINKKCSCFGSIGKHNLTDCNSIFQQTILARLTLFHAERSWSDLNLTTLALTNKSVFCNLKYQISFCRNIQSEIKTVYYYFVTLLKIMHSDYSILISNYLQH